MSVLLALALRQPKVATAIVLSAVTGAVIASGAGAAAGVAAFAFSAAITSTAALMQVLARPA